MNATPLPGLVCAARPIALADLDATAALLTRRDRKYLVPWADATRYLRQLVSCSRVLEIDGARAFRYRSVYFDTPSLESYLAAARRRPRRFKVRTRSYVDAGTSHLEIKTRDPRGRTVKLRVAHPFEHGHELDAADRAFVAGCPLIADKATELRPVLTTSYVRATLLLAEGARVTVDIDLRSEAPDGRTASLPGMAVIETKSEGPPTSADRLLWSLGHRPLKVSKFGTSLSVLYPGLPSNKWRRALCRPWVEEPGQRSAQADLALAG